MKSQSWLQGCGLTFLLMLAIDWVYISPSRTILYHSILPISPIYWGLSIDAVIVCILAGAALTYSDRLSRKADTTRPAFWWAIIGAVFVWRLHGALLWRQLIGAKPIPPRLTFVICLGCGLAIWHFSRPAYIRIVESIRLSLSLLGICMLWLIPQLLYMAIHSEPHETAGFLRVGSERPLPQRRIVWLVFDELSEDQLFEHRQADVQLPSFDRLRAQSLVFRDVVPAGFYTELVIPSLLWGKQVIEERSTLDGELSVRTSQGWNKFPPTETLFADAKRSGLTTGAAGWYIPYCRTFSEQLNWCQWRSSALLTGDYSGEKSILWNVFAPIRGFFLRMADRNYERNFNAIIHESDYKQLLDASRDLIFDENIQFVFLHIPAPHPWGIYNRRTHAFSQDGTYLDNLALADATLSNILEWIAETKSHSQTTVVLCSDHSWRVSYWSSIANWSKEEQQASQGKFDPRPVLMVHLPGQDHPGEITQPFSALREHDLVENLLRNTPAPENLEAWAGANR